MARVKARELKNLSEAELDQKLGTLKRELFELSAKKITGQLDKPHLFKYTKKQIAQVNTIKREKESAHVQ